ncbi:hypothetical protein GN956_G13206 [Arapaima gigas]
MLRPPAPLAAPRRFSGARAGSHHADAPLARLFPPPPLAELLFHSKMASALEPPVSGCIFGLVVVSVSSDFWHVPRGHSTLNPGPAHC